MRNTEKKVRGNEIEQNGIRVLKALLCAYVLTGILLLLLTGLLYKWNLDEGKVTAGIIVIYVVSTFIGGFMIGRCPENGNFYGDWPSECCILYCSFLYHSVCITLCREALQIS